MNSTRACGGAALIAVLLGCGVAAHGQGMQFLDNGAIRIGIDTSKGGAIVTLQPSGTAGAALNVVNSYDLGREIQQSYYSGPSDFQPPGTTQNPNWNPWPWNPVQAGDSYGNKSTLVASSNNGSELYVKSIPRQWALQNVASECALEQWITLSGSVATVRNRLTNARSDTTQYAALTQELPAVYTTANLTTLKTYAGTQPFTGGTLATMPNTPPPEWGSFRGTEGWAAYVNSSDWGLGVFVPGNVAFKGGLFLSGTATGTSSPSTGYIAPLRQEIIDHNIVYDYTYHLILGSVASIRAYAVANKPALNPDYQFQSTRDGWFYKGGASDTGFPIADHLTVNLAASDPQMWGPECTFQAANVPKLYIRAAFDLASGTTASSQLFWERDNGASPISEANSKRMTVINDGQYRIYELDLSSTSAWTGQISRLRFDPVVSGTAGDTMDIQFISASYPSTISIDVSGTTQTQVQARNAFLTGTYGVTKLGSGTLTLTSSNAYTGPTRVAGGLLVLGTPTAIANSTFDTQSGTAVGGLSFGTLTTATFGGLTGSNGLTLTNAASTPAGVTLTVGGNGQSTRFAGGLSGLGGVVKTGTGTLSLTGTNSSIGGPLTVNTGRVVVDPGATGLVSVAGKLQIAAGAGATAGMEILSGSCGLTSSGIASIGDGSGTSTLDAKGGTTTMTVSASRFLIGNKGSGALNVSGGSFTMSGTNAITVGGDSQFAANNATGAITVSGGTLSITGSGVLRLGVNVSGTTTGARGTINLDGGVFATARSLTVGTGTGTVNFNGGTLRTLASSTSLLAVTAARVGPGGAVIDTAGNTVTIRQALVTSGSGAGGLRKIGVGTLTLAAANTFTGTTSVVQGTLQVGDVNALSSSAVTVAAGATLSVAPQVAAAVPALVNNGLVDVGLGGLTVKSGLTAAGIVAGIKAGRSDGTWSGTSGITSSAAAAMSDRAVGWIDNGDGSFTTAFAAAGDLNVNGIVDLDDVIAFVSGGLYDTGLPATWAQGDYDYNGIVDLDDVIAFVGGGLYDKGPYNTTPSGLSLRGFGGDDDLALMSGGFAAVPEPAAWLLATLGAACAAWARMELRQGSFIKRFRDRNHRPGRAKKVWAAGLNQNTPRQ